MTTAAKPALDAFLPTAGGLEPSHDLTYSHLHLDHTSSTRPPQDVTSPGNPNGGRIPATLAPSRGELPLTSPALDDCSLLPPSKHPAQPDSQRLRASLSPTRQRPSHAAFPYHFSPPDVHAAASLYRSVSVDASSPSSNPANAPTGHLVQRLAQQNALIREAWEAERNYLEANRRRAEEVYQEERLIMDEVREVWENEKAALLRENQLLKERIQRLEGENETLRSIAGRDSASSGAGVASPAPGASVEATVGPAASTPSSSRSPPRHALVQHLTPVADPASLPPGLDGASRRPHHVPGPGSVVSPNGPPDQPSFVPLDPRTQPQTGNHRDFLARPAAEGGDHGSVIDIGEVDPKLEGIPLRATAVQRFTFGESGISSPVASPPAIGEGPQHEPRQELAKRHSSKDNTLQAMRAEESRRLTMHAGHTPNHSLSLFPALSVADGSNSHTRDDSGPPSQGECSLNAGSPPPEEVEGAEGPTETLEPGLPEDRHGSTGAATHHEADKATSDNPGADDPSHGGSDEPQAPGLDAEDEDATEHFEPAEDVRLKGPLMVKNIPAQDEIFWDQVNRKLEPISQGQDALPAVMRPDEEEFDNAPPNEAAAAATTEAPLEPTSTIEDGEEAVGDEKGVEGDVPLKMRSTTNFGAPFGMA